MGGGCEGLLPRLTETTH